MTQQYMGQIPDPAQESGTDLTARLNGFDNAHRTNQSGPTRPANILEGGIWTRVVDGVFDLMVFDGAQDHVLMRGAANLAGLTDLDKARKNLGLKALATKDKAAIDNDTTGTLPLNRGGTGGTTQAAAREGLGFTLGGVEDMTERGLYHPDRGYWQTIEVDPKPYLVIVTPERVEIAEDDSPTIIPAVTRQTTQLAELLANYPEGTVEVPLKPGADHELNGTEWVYVAPLEPTPEELRAALPPITRRQLRLTLVRYGDRSDRPQILDDVAAMIEAMPDGLAKEEARIEWDDASQFERLHPTLVLIGDGMGMTPEQVDELWAEAMRA